MLSSSPFLWLSASTEQDQNGIQLLLPVWLEDPQYARAFGRLRRRAWRPVSERPIWWPVYNEAIPSAESANRFLEFQVDIAPEEFESWIKEHVPLIADDVRASLTGYSLLLQQWIDQHKLDKDRQWEHRYA